MGRISANSSSDLSNIVNKTLAYEKATFLEYTGTDWYESSALVGDPSSTGNSAIITNEYIENMLNAFDFDDLLVKSVDLLEANPDLLDRYQDHFSFVLVDEYQDTNSVQFRFVEMLASKHKNLMVVGDDDQSIYGWRGANIRNILDFEKAFPGTHVVFLEQNYRSTNVILSAANAVIAVLNNGTKKK